MNDCDSTWVGGLTCDHLFADCPNYKRGLPELRRYQMEHIGGGHIDPHGGDVCGLCLHRHNQREHITSRRRAGGSSS